MFQRLLLISLLFVTNSLFAQRDTSHAADSFFTSQSQQLKELEKIRIDDSLKRAALENTISELKSTDQVKKQELLQELEDMKMREAGRIAMKKQKFDSLRAFIKGFPVTPFFGDTLFSVYNKLGSFSAQERAAEVTRRIRKLADNYFFTKDSLQVVAAETTVDIVYGDDIITSISENDALWHNTTREELAARYKNIIGDAEMKYKEATSFQTISKEIITALIVLVILSTIIFLITSAFRFTRKKILAQQGKHIKGIKIRNYELLDVDRQMNFFLGLNNFLKWVGIITAVYFSLPVLFSIFPWTEDFAGSLINYILHPVKNILLKVWHYLPNLITIIIIVVIFRYVLKGIRFLKTEIEQGILTIPGFYADWATPTYQIIKLLLYAFMFIVIFPYLPGSDSPVFKGVSVFLGVLFTFGSSGSLSNVVAGLVLTYMRAFRIGDRVKIGDVTGDIIERSLLVTRLRTIKNEIISIPNSNVMSSHTINYSSDAAEKGLILHTTATLGYDVPWREVHNMLIDAALRTEYILKDPSPFVLQTSLDDFYVSYQINAYTHEPNKQAIIYSQLIQHIQDVCREAGVELMSPHYHAIRDGNEVTIPKK